MDHLAILAKQRKLLQKIIEGEKTIESRWYKSKKTPFGMIKAGDRVYFKDSGEPVTVIADVEKALFFEGVDEATIQKILKEYGKQICIKNYDLQAYKGINYVTLVFLKNVKEIQPFDVDKTGYGVMAAWITVDNINKIKKHPTERL